MRDGTRRASAAAAGPTIRPAVHGGRAKAARESGTECRFESRAGSPSSWLTRPPGRAARAPLPVRAVPGPLPWTQLPWRRSMSAAAASICLSAWTSRDAPPGTTREARGPLMHSVASRVSSLLSPCASFLFSRRADGRERTLRQTARPLPFAFCPACPPPGCCSCRAGARTARLVKRRAPRHGACTARSALCSPAGGRPHARPPRRAGHVAACAVARARRAPGKRAGAEA